MNNYDKDPVLGQKVAQYLASLGIDNPIKAPMDSGLVTQSITDLIKGLGIIPDDDSIQKTPERVARFFVNELFYGLDYNNFPKITFNHNQYGYQDPVISKNISFKSTCEHHLVTISGEAFVAYIPKDNVIGLSKINRVVNFFARRPQVQERATLQIFHALAYILQTEDIALLIKASHHCITMRGVSDHNVENITYQFGGQFTNPEMKRNFLELIKDNQA
jgi:GTP cyclohydrolase I